MMTKKTKYARPGPRALILLLLIAAALSGAARAQTGALNGFCDLGGKQAVTSGLNSSNYLQGNIPNCTVTVYLTGTTTKATIYSDAINTPLANPFKASIVGPANAGKWLFFAATNQGLDVVMSGGNAPNTYPSPVTLTDIFPNSSFSPVSGVTTINTVQGGFTFTGPDVNCVGTNCNFSNTTGAAIQTNSTPNTTQDLLNFTDTPTVKFSNPSGGVESATVPNATNSSKGVAQCDGTTTTCTAGVISANPSTNFQHNGTNLPDQALLNFLDTPPSLPSGYTPVTFSNDGSGGLGAYVPPIGIGSGLAMYSTPPTSTTYITVYPSGFTSSGADTQFLAEGGLSSAWVINSGCTIGGCGGTGPANVIWTFTLPSYVNPANVTAVWATTVANARPYGNGTGFTSTGQITCSQGINTYDIMTPDPTSYLPWYTMSQFNAHMTAVAGSQVSTVTCQAQVSASSVVQAGLALNVASIFLQLADSVDTPPSSTAVDVVAPLYYNGSLNTLGIDTSGLQGALTLTTSGTSGAATLNGNTLNIPNYATSATIVNVNGSSVSNPNFNGSTPAAGSNGKNVAFQVSGSNVSAELVGDGNAAHYLDGTGGYSTPAGAGTLTSINSQTGPAITLQSTGATVAITTPSSNVINLEAVASASGVQYDASNTDYVFTGTSFWSDDTRILGAVITVTSGSCNATTCSIVNSGTNNFSVGDWVIVSSMTGWPAAPAPYGNGSFNNAGYSDIVQVSATGLSSTTFQFLSPITATITGGSVENANQFSTMQFGRLPFANGHGLIHAVFGANHRCSDVDTNYATLIHPQSPAVTGHPGYLILNGCGNDIGAGDSVATVEGHLQSIWQKAHTDSFVMVQGNMIIGNPGALVSGDHTFKLSQLNDWIEGQGQSFSTLTPYCTTDCGKYWDRALDFHAAMSNVSAPNMFASNGGVGTGGAVATANLVNEALVNKATSFKTQNAFSYFGWWGSNLPFNGGPGWIYSPPNALDAVVVTTSDQTDEAFAVDTKVVGGQPIGIRVKNLQIFGVATSPSTSPLCPNGVNGQLTTSGCVGTSGISGATAGQALIAGSATTATSSKALAGTGTGLVTGPTTSTAGDLLTYADTSGTTQDSGILLSSLAPKASPTFTGTPDASGATQFKLPVGAGFASAANGEVGYDSTNKNWHLWKNGADSLLIPFPGSPTSGDCYAPTVSGGVWSMVDAGGPCGISGGGVTAWSGDGALYDNSSSTASVVAHLANAAAHKFWGNNTGSTAAPGYESITAADLTGIRQWSCQPGLGDGLNAITAGTYLQSTCKNTTGVTVTLTGLQCFTDNSGTSTMNAAGNTLGALLTGAVTCTSSFAAGTQSANVALTNGDYIKFTFVADGTSKQATWVVTGTY